MKTENENKNILKEHDKVGLTRYYLSLANFIAVLLGTVVTLVFLLRRGAPGAVLSHTYILLVINVAQIAVCTVDLISKRYFGVYIKWLSYVSYGVALLWLLTVAGELTAGTLELGALRTDLVAVTAIQAVGAVAAYLIWPWMDRKAIDTLTSQKVRNGNLQKKTARGYVIKYAIMCAVIALLQAGSLLVYKLPPTLYDLFAESRAVKYELTEDGEGYVVTNVYRGTASKLVIPAEYNGRPVVGIAQGALIEDGILDKYKVSQITLGTLNGEGVLESNLRYIESGAISNNKIKSLSLPESLTSIADNAVKSTSLETLEYRSRADFSAAMFPNCTSLSHVKISGEKVGNIRSLEGMSHDVTIEVDKEIYNSFRQNNMNYIDSFVPILDGEFCVDFYTDSDYYINSIFAPIGSEISLRYTDLKNDTLRDKVSPSVDTLAYIQNRHELGTDGSKAKSAFRGWYTDPVYADECVFTQGGAVTFRQSTSLYARWIDEYTGYLDWGTYKPQNAIDRLYWTDEDVSAFPVIAPSERIGYREGIKWTVSGSNEQVVDSRGISRDATIKGEWIFDAPYVDIIPDETDSDIKISETKNDVTFVYAPTRSLRLEAHREHTFSGIYNHKEIEYEYIWEKAGVAQPVERFETLTLQNVLESGQYMLTVVAISPYGEQAAASTVIRVEITPADITVGNVSLENGTAVYNGQTQRNEFVGTLPADLEAAYTYSNAGGSAVSSSGVRDAGSYNVRVVFQKRSASERSNYKTYELTADFNITPKPLTVVEWRVDGAPLASDSLVYNAQAHVCTLQFGGRIGSDTVDLIYGNTTSATNAGDYYTTVTGVSNMNYSIASQRYDWKISPKPVTVSAWQLDGRTNASNAVVYNGLSHSAYAEMSGRIGSDSVAFLYESNASYSNIGTTAGKYQSKITGVNNKNYCLGETDTTYIWEIAKKALAVSFNSPSLIYNAKLQGVTATVSGFVSDDLARVTDDVFDLSEAGGITEISGVASGQSYFVKFSAINANLSGNTYTAKVNGLSASNAVAANYYIQGSSVTKAFTIAPKPLSFSEADSPATVVYNGGKQALYLFVNGFEEEDIGAVTFNDFTVTGLMRGARVKDENSYLLICDQKDAGDYPVSVTGIGNPNYKIAGNTYTKTFKINKKPLTVSTWALTNHSNNQTINVRSGQSTTIPYNGTGYGYSIVPTIEGVVSGESVTLNYNNASTTDAGSYTATAALDATTYSNYSFGGATASWTIVPHTLDLEWLFNGVKKNVSNSAATTFVYNGKTVAVSAEFSPLGSDELTLTYESNSGLSAVNAGTYLVKVSAIGGEKSGNYKLGKNLTFNWNITPAEVTVNWTEPQSFVYDGTNQGPSFSLSGFVDEDSAAHKVTVTASVSNATLATKDLTYSSANTYTLAGANGLTKNAGAYTVSVKQLLKGSAVDGNYVVVENDCPFTIAPKPVTITGTWYYDGTKEYIGAVTYRKTEYTLTTAITAGQVVSGDTVNLRYSGNVYSAYSTAYTARVTGVDNNNYTLSGAVTKSWSIAKKLINITWTDPTDTVYSGTAKTVLANYTTGAANDSDGKVYTGDSLTLALTGNSHIDADTYTAGISSTGNTNYAVAGGYSTHTWSISPKPITLTWSFNTINYDGTVHIPTASYQGENNTVTAADYAGDLSAINANVGSESYSVTAIGLNNSNYKYANGSDRQQTSFTITPVPVTVQWDGASSNQGTKTYNGANLAPTCLVRGVGGVALTSACTVTPLNAVDAGGYVFEVTAISNTNYVLTGVENTKYTLTVNPAAVTIRWDGSSERTFTKIYNGTNQGLVCKVMGLNNLDLTDVSTVATPEEDAINYSSSAYTYKVTAVNNKNYTVEGVANATATLYIAKRGVSVTWSGNESLVYDGMAHTLVGTVKDGNAVVETKSESYTNAGTYTLTFASLANANYTLSGAVGSLSGSLIIAPQKVKIVWSGNDTFTYDGQPHSLNAEVLGADDNARVKYISYTYTNASSTPYTATVSSLDTTNYTLEGATGGLTNTLKINPLPVVLTWTNPAEKVYDGTASSAVAVVSNLKSGDTLTLSYALEQSGVSLGSGNSVSNAGICTVRIAGLGGSSSANYTLTGATGVSGGRITIHKRPVVIRWDNSEDTAFTKVYNGKNQKLTCSVQGVNNLNLTNSCTITSPDAINYSAGAYTYKVSAVNNSNYTLDGVENTTATLSITKKGVTVTWSGNDTFTYDGKAHALTATFKDGTTVVETQSKSYTDAGTYTLTIDTLSNENYTLDGVTGSLSNTITIDPLPIVLHWTNPAAKVYDGTASSASAAVSNLKSGDNLTLTFALERDGVSFGSGNSAVNAGTYTVRVARLGGTASANYTLVGATNVAAGSITINPRPVVIRWDNSQKISFTKVYNGADQALTCSVQGVGGTELTGYVLSAPSAVNAGTYTYSVTGLGNNPNYTLTGASATATLTIEKQAVNVAWIGNNSVVYDGAEHTLTAQVTGAGNKAVPFTYVGTRQYVHAGEYEIAISIDDTNYTFSAAATKASLTINKQALIVTWSGNGTAVYDGAEHTVTAQVKGAVDGKTVVFSYVGENSFTEPGSHTVQIQIGNPDYACTADDAATTLEITAANAEILLVVPETVTEGTTVAELKASVTATLTNSYGNEISVEFAVYDSTGAKLEDDNVLSQGEYSVKVERLLGDKSANYVLNSSEAQKSVTVVEEPETEAPVEPEETNE